MNYLITNHYIDTVQRQEVERKVTEGVTLRMEKSLLEQLRAESEQKQISFNTFANQIFKQHIEWFNNAGKALLVSFPKALLVMLMDKFTEEEVAKLGRKMAKEEVKDIIMLIKNEYTPESFLKVVESWAQASNIPYRRTVKDTIHHFVIQHDMSKKWSLYLATLFESVFEELISKKIECDITKNTFSFRVDI